MPKIAIERPALVVEATQGPVTPTAMAMEQRVPGVRHPRGVSLPRCVSQPTGKGRRAVRGLGAGPAALVLQAVFKGGVAMAPPSAPQV